MRGSTRGAQTDEVARQIRRDPGLILCCGLSVTGYAAREFLRENALLEAKAKAKLMMEAATAMRVYTKAHIQKLVPEQSETGEFNKETVPAFAAKTMFDYLRIISPTNTPTERPRPNRPTRRTWPPIGRGRSSRSSRISRS